MTGQTIEVTTHVGRDILQSSQLFRTVEAAVWEYVVNSLEYVDPGVTPEVEIRLDQRGGRITIADNGRGMDVDGLKQFFTMHGENVDRRRGLPGRGKFGTGKSAAFGIGKRLEVATVRNERRNVVELRREMIDASEGDAVPTAWLVRDEPAPDAPNGTVVTIDGVERRLKTDPIVRLIERHLAHWRAVDPKVVVGSHVCQPWEPETSRTDTYTPPENLADQIGDVTLTVHVSRVPLEEAYRGIAVTAGQGNLLAFETAGVDRKDFGNYLFGEVDVPRLDSVAEGGTVAAHDVSRSLELNRDHPVAAAVLAFIGSSMEQTRQELVREHQEAKERAEARELDEAADEIAELLNKDLKQVSERFNQMRNQRLRAGAISRIGEREQSGGEEYGPGEDVPGLLDLEPRERTDEPVTPRGETDPGIPRGRPDEDGQDTVSPRGEGSTRERRSGGLAVEFASLGADEERSHYDRDRKTILINLDHPMISAAKESTGVEDVTFRRLAYEIAFTQYALAIAREVYEQDPAITADDALYEVREALRRVTAHGAYLYRSA